MKSKKSTAVKKSSKMDESSLGGLKPSLSVYLNASSNATSDKIGKSNSIVKNILKDMEKIKRSKHPKSEQACGKIEKLVYFIVQTLRRMNSDHLLQTTVIWVLITLLRLNYDFSRKMMVAAGVPGALYDIMSVRIYKLNSYKTISQKWPTESDSVLQSLVEAYRDYIRNAYIFII